MPPVRSPAPSKAALARSNGHTIKVVAERTGLEMGTLRAWERRYGFPRPERKEGSNRRLYSDADVTRLLSIQRLLERGYRVGDVIAKSEHELDELARDASNAAASGGATSAPVPELMALLQRDRIHEIELRLRESAVALGPRRFVTELVHPFAVAVGQAWAEERISVHQEHLATEGLITQIRQMLASYMDIRARPLVLLATLPGEHHTLPLEMVALYLVVVGAKPRLIGGPTPPLQIAESARVLGAEAVAIGITLANQLAPVRKDVATLRSALKGETRLWLGGAGAPALEGSGPGTTLIDSWDALDRAVAECRTPSRRAAADRRRP